MQHRSFFTKKRVENFKLFELSYNCNQQHKKQDYMQPAISYLQIQTDINNPYALPWSAFDASRPWQSNLLFCHGTHLLLNLLAL